MSAPSWAVPGAKVVCVSDRSAERHLKSGTTYEIKSVGFDMGSVFLRLCGVWDMGGPSSGWFLSRFRPLVTRTEEQDVALFKHLLNTTPASEDA